MEAEAGFELVCRRAWVWVLRSSTFKAVARLACVEVPGLSLRCGDVTIEGFSRGDVWPVTLRDDPLLGALQVKGKLELVVIPPAGSAAGFDEGAAVLGDEVQQRDGARHGWRSGEQWRAAVFRRIDQQIDQRFGGFRNAGFSG